MSVVSPTHTSAVSSASGAPLLEIVDITKRFGGVHALRGASLTISGRGIVHGLIGENGSGKSTTLGVMSGQLRPDSGAVRLDGREVTFHKPLDAIAHGIAMVSQETALAPHLSVAENILLGHRTVSGRFGIDWKATSRKAGEVLDVLGLDLDPEQAAGELSPDRQQMVEIARALSMDARVLILDEPTSSLTDDQVASLFRTIRSLKGHGVSVVFVSHRLGELTELADELTVLRDGRTAASGPMSEFDAHRIVDEMVGQESAWSTVGRPVREYVPPLDTRPALTVTGLRMPNTVNCLDLTVAPGEIVGVAGLLGSGRSELLSAVFGDQPISAGRLQLHGRAYVPTNPRAAILRGIGYLPPDRKTRGLVVRRSVRDNLAMALTAFTPRLTPFRASTTSEVVRDLMKRMRVRASSPDVTVATLSGGNQQKIALGKWLAAGSTVLLLDEPTRGVDVAAKGEIHELLRSTADGGAALLVSSSENEELIELCDRIVVMFKGEIVASIPAHEATEALLGRYTGGQHTS
jgi:ABC-type sugar transport system ATPase subunit